MQLQIPIKALSVNNAFQGRRFKSPAHRAFENDVCKLIPFGDYPKNCTDPVYVVYIFSVHNYGLQDVGNMEKPITDILVSRGYFNDDRYIKALFLAKERCEKGQESIGIIITQDPQEYAYLVNKYLLQ